VNEDRLRTLLHEVPVPPGDRAAALAAVRQAFAERERVSWPRRHVRSLALCAAGAAVVAAAASPPGQAVLHRVRKAIGVEHAQPALFSLPAPGRLLVTSSAGAWVVSPDGSKRLLGRYREASWSPFGRFVVAAGADELAALEPNGTVRWTLARPGVRFPRWTGTHTDTRIAYLSGSRLRLVGGDGRGDVDACGERAAAPVAPAWRPGPRRVLAYATATGRVEVLDAGACSLLWRSRPYPAPRLLLWSSDGARLALVTPARVVVFTGGASRGRALAGATAAAWRPGTHQLAVIRQGQVLLLDGDRPAAPPARLFAGAGSLAGLAWSPDARWLLVGWPAADQWLFVRGGGRHRLLAVSNVSAQFRASRFPRVDGWCCVAPPP